MSVRPRAKFIETSAARDRRFRRTPMRPRRKKGRGWGVSWAVVRAASMVVLPVVFIGALAHRVLVAPAFLIDRILVRGNVRLSTGEVVALMEGFKGQHLLNVDLDRWRHRLLGSPWVAEARLRLMLPATIEVGIVERIPLAIARIDGQLLLVDGSGVVIDEYGPQYADIDLPIVDGLSHTAEEGSEARARTGLISRALVSLSARRDLLKRVSQIDVHDSRDAIVILHDDGTRVHLGDTAFAERLHSYLELAPALLSRVPAIDYVDLRFEPRIFVRPAGGAETDARKVAGALLP
jgi:cell division septal protein FtsQ